MRLTRRDDELRALGREMQASVGELLFRCARLLDERAIAEVNREVGLPVLRPALTNVFPHLDFAGVRLTELARRLGVTKQAAGQLVGELEELGMIEYSPDPDDGRAKRIRFSSRGIEAVRHGLGVLRRIENELERAIGAARMRALRDALPAAVAHLTTHGAASVSAPAKPAPAERPVKRPVANRPPVKRPPAKKK